VNDLANNIKKILIVFLILFISIISYFSYFILFKHEEFANSQMNQRILAKENKVLGGTIFDRNMKPLTERKRVSELHQKTNYLGGAAFAHALGYRDVTYGITGLEYLYNDDLTYEPIVDFKSLISKNSSEDKQGRGVVTTLDYNLQKTAYELLGDKKGAIVVLNPKTGEILAMVSTPSFDPNNLKDNWSQINSNKDRPLLNRAVSGLYPPGSVFKMITCTSALENISNVTNRTFEDKGKIYFNNSYSLSNFDGEVLGNINLEQGFYHSSNVVFGTLAMELGNDKLKATAEKYFFNKDLKGEGIVVDNSKFPTISKGEQGNIAQSGIGQSSILATPMLIANVAASIANDGVMMRPTLVNEVVDSDGKRVRKIDYKKMQTITTTEVASTIKSYMRKTVTSGTATAANLGDINVAGKTGTADHDDSKKPHSWFAGFAPYENPQIAIAVIVEEGGQGGGVATQIASKVIKAALVK
jgi:cell division protein FtsI/penicillin-binding protein 2